ncbi:MAG TPA: MaoC family dehydratase [Solirubrobacteraceae bacterium]|jgi:acyl dehydratase|nr:MaoC family dehydratase [Solirubrobacteraceae bacterium]
MQSQLKAERPPLRGASGRRVGLDELRQLAGHELGVSSWHEVTQGEIDAFADTTGDRQFIHTDPRRARATTFGGTIAHGYYTLSLAPALLGEVVSLERFPMAVTYGLDRLRFPAPLPVGDSVRMRVELDAVDDFSGGATLALTLTFERATSDIPACVANVLYRIFENEG